MERLIVKACDPVIDLKVGVPLDHSVSLCFVSLPAFRTLWVTFQAKNNVRSASASTVPTQVSHRSHNSYTANHHLYNSGERTGAQRRTKLSFGRTMMQTLELLQCKNQAHSLNSYRVTLV